MKPNYNELLNLRAYNPNEKPPPDHVVFRIEQRNIGSLGNFIIISGLPKRGKGKFISAIAASALTGQHIWGLHTFLPEGRRRVGFFDTDQSRYDFYKNIDLVNHLAEVNSIHKNMNAYNVRQDGPHVICNMVDTYLKDNPDCSMLIIDNIGDLLNNFNDEGQSKELINYFKRITDQKNILIVATLHLGKSNNSTIGHLGAMSDRYAQSILTCEKIGVQYHLKLKDSRTAAEFTPIAIYYNEFTNQWQQTTPAEDAAPNVKPLKARPADIPDDEHRHKMRLIFATREVFTYEDLTTIIKEYYPGVGKNWANDCIAHCREAGIIFRIPEGYTMQKQTRLYVEK
jgi:archaellum biogenesis ATPase FlaH